MVPLNIALSIKPNIQTTKALKPSNIVLWFADKTFVTVYPYILYKATANMNIRVGIKTIGSAPINTNASKSFS